MKIKFVDLPRQNKIYKKQLLKILKEIVLNAEFSLGPKLEKFEKDFAKYCGKKYCIGVNSGIDALLLPLMAYGIGPGMEVIVPANSYFGTAMVVSNVGANPVFVDCGPNTFNIDVTKIEKAITKKTKAIIPVHLYGQPADIDKIYTIAKKHNLTVIEDAAQAHGSTFKSKKIPFGETGGFSFYPGKNLGAFGDGGAVVTDSKQIAEKIKYLRNDGAYNKYVHEVIGVKSRLDTLQAAILSFKLTKLDAWNKKRQKAVEIYKTQLKDVKGINLPEVGLNRTHIFHVFAITTAKRDMLQKFLKKHGVETNIHYPIPIHLQKAYKNLGHKIGDFPASERLSKTLLSLPMFPEITKKEIEYICDLIKKFFDK